jgi:bis(5'-nucleosidyl)-tetraphosphatase
VEARRLSAGAVVYRREQEKHRFVLLRAYKSWDFPKGRVEPGEEPLQAAIREVREETGIADLEFPIGTAFVETPPYARGKVARFYLAETRTAQVVLGVNPEGIREHHEWRWLPYEAARFLLVDRLRAVLDWAERAIRESPLPGKGES